MFICSKCNREFKSKAGLIIHEKSCNGIDNRVDKFLVNNKYICPFCGKEQKKFGIVPHIKCVHEGRNCLKNYNSEGRCWNKGLSKETDSRILKQSSSIKKYYMKNQGSFKGRHHSEMTKEKLSMSAKENKLGGHPYRRKIIYKGISLGSSYELILAKNLDENQIKWNIPNRFNYVDKFGKRRTYTPDFYLPEYDIYLDPKNWFLINNINPSLGFSDLEKIKWVMEQNGVRIIVLNEGQLNWEYIRKFIVLRKH